MHIVFIADVPFRGGATDCLLELASVLQNSYGVEVTVCTAQQSDLNCRLDAIGVRNIVTGHSAFLFAPPGLRIKRPIALINSYIKYKWNFMRSIRAAEKQIDFTTVDIIHSNLPRTDLGEELAKRNNLPHVCHLREFSFTHFSCLSFRKNPVRYISDNSEAIIAISHAIKEGWTKRGMRADKVEVIYDGVDIDQLAFSRSFGFDSEEHRVANGDTIRAVFLGGCSEAKGVWDAIKAVLALREVKNITLDIYGSDSRATALKVKAYLRMHNLCSQVAVKDYEPDITSKLTQYNVAFVCSKAEGFGRSIVECQIMGVPVIASNTGACPELIADGVSGLLYNKTAGVNDLVAKVLELFSDMEAYNAIRVAGRNSAMRFGTINNAASIFKLYSRLILAKE